MNSKTIFSALQVMKACRNYSYNSIFLPPLAHSSIYHCQLNSKNYIHSSSEPADKTKKKDNASKDAEKPPVSDWIREIHEKDDRPVVQFRRQDYPNPLKRTLGILKDDLTIYFSGISQAFKEIKESVNTKEGIGAEQSKERMPNENNSGLENEPAPPYAEELKKVSAHVLSSSINKGKKKKKNILDILSKMSLRESEIWPGNCDILVVGGGAVGSSIAYHLTKQATDGIRVVVVDKDLTYKHSSTVLSLGGIRHQFSVPENILLSMYGMQFMRELPNLLQIPGDDPPCVNFQPHGYLTLSSEEGFEQLQENYAIQRHFNAQVKLLGLRELKEKFPWMNPDGLAGGVLGLEGEGWFDPWSLLSALRRKAVHQGAHYIEAEVTGMEYVDDPSSIHFVDGHPTNSHHSVKYVKMRLPDGEERTISPAFLVLAAGAQTGAICYDMLGIGKAKEGMMAYPVPIEPRKRYVYCFHAPKGPGLATPLVVDPSGAYFRREGFGNMFLAGMSPPEDEEPPCDNFDVDHDYFLDRVWPVIANRVPGFEELKVQGSWSGFYEYNIFDQNGIVGMHPIVDNLMLAAGFSGHGIQHSLGVGRAVMERLLHAEFRTIDMTRFELERIHLNEPLYEDCIV